MASEVLKTQKQKIYVRVCILIDTTESPLNKQAKKNQMCHQFIVPVNAVTCGDIYFLRTSKSPHGGWSSPLKGHAEVSYVLSKKRATLNLH